MRTPIGFGLIAILGFVACTTETVVVKRGSDTGGGDGTSTSTDPNEPDPNQDPSNPSEPPKSLVQNLSITDVAFFQAVKVPVVAEGAPVAKRNAPVVANRPALVRVYVAPEEGWAGREVTATIQLSSGTKKFSAVSETKTISAASKDEDTKSTFNLEVPGESLPPDVTWSVALTAADGVRADGPSNAQYPRDGKLDPLGAEPSGKLRIVLVPVQYDTDGSGRKPDVGAAQVDRYKKTMMARYPTSEVEMTVHAPFSWTTPITRNGSGFSSVLKAMMQLRQQEKADKSVYYYGALAPAISMDSFCENACVTGLSTVNDDIDSEYFRASVGIGFAGDDAANTMAHEVGHAHGREHAPCGGASGVDPGFPYSGGAIGVWGYDMFTKKLISPTKGRDMMGYCPNEWVSDYTFNALFERVSLLGAAKSVKSGPTSGASRTFQIATVGADGTLTPEGDIELDSEPGGGEAREASFVGRSGTALAKRDARFYRFDHLPGGFVVLPKDVAEPWTHVQISGLPKALAR